MVLSACSQTPQEEQLSALTPPERDTGPFGVDVNINMDTIDDYLERPDVAYFDMRMFYDTADYESIGGVSKLTRTFPGYRIVPAPYLFNLGEMPVAGAYEGKTLFTITWGEPMGTVIDIKANYLESEVILNEIFPKDKPIFLMCGGAGYTALTRGLLVNRGWDESKIYHTGGNWHYEGDKSLDLMVSGSDSVIATWRANYAFIDFDNLTPVN